MSAPKAIVQVETSPTRKSKGALFMRFQDEQTRSKNAIAKCPKCKRKIRAQKWYYLTCDNCQPFCTRIGDGVKWLLAKFGIKQKKRGCGCKRRQSKLNAFAGCMYLRAYQLIVRNK